ncbi:MAG: class II fructose-bisphosphate aldolase [Bacilli bacterium]|nr:class II fructose-bisphosphate aldolase [Bacilli bacterium]
MALVTMKSEMIRAEKKGYAVPAFNFFTLENLVGIAKGAAEKKSPVIAMATCGGIKVMGEKATARLCEGVAGDFGIDMVLHLDHCTDFELLKRCVDNGFTSVMIDASSKSFQENIDETSRVVEYAIRYGVTVEAELGHVGGKEDDIVVDDMSVLFTQPEEAVKFVKLTGVDCLAVAVGTVHGFYKSTPKLDFPRIAKIHELLPDTPLVLHGGTGVPDDDFRKAIALGVRKINIGTELKVHGVFDVAKKGYAESAQDDPRLVSKLVIAKCAEIVKEKIDVMGSAKMAY